jgi:hypothetical protein
VRSNGKKKLKEYCTEMTFSETEIETLQKQWNDCKPFGYIKASKAK